jgi:hypothetical protein
MKTITRKEIFDEMIHRSDNAAETGSETPKSGHKM